MLTVSMRAYLLIAKLCGAMLLLMVSLGVLGISQMLTISDTNSAYTRLLHEEVARLQTLRTLTAGFFQVNRLCLNAAANRPKLVRFNRRTSWPPWSPKWNC